jgi:ABC-type branched-subunit amino acid transport system substrate-binding protein
MTAGARVGLWARESNRGQLSVTIAVAGLATIALIASAVPQTRSQARLGTSAGGGSTAPKAASGTTANTPTNAAADTTSVGSAPSTGPSSLRAGGARGPSGSLASSDPTTPEQVPAASDQGVAADSIKIGFTLNRPANLSATGFAFGLRQDDAQAIKAMIDYANAAGGVQGRKLTYVTVDVDPTNRSSWQTACLRLTEDEKVFSVLNPGAYLGVGHNCYLDHHVPQATSGSVSMSQSFFDQAQGYIASGGANANRVLLNWAATMLNAGVIAPGKQKVGLLRDDCPEYVEPWTQLHSFLNDSGIAFTEVQVSCDIGAAQQQVPAAVLQLRQGGAQVALLGAIFSTDQTFMLQAQAQGWKPKYSVSDLWANNVDPLSKNFPPDQFDRAIGSAFNRSGEEAANVPYSAGVQKCNEMITAAGLPPVAEQMGKDAQVVANCDNFFLWLAVMQHLPVNFTRADWAAAVTSVGSFDLSAWSATATFAPGKYEGGDSYALVEWHRECTCWVQIQSHQSGRF